MLGAPNGERSRTRRAIGISVALAIVALVALGACDQVPREVGGSCLKDTDCASSYCVAYRCAVPGVTDAEAPVIDGAIRDAAIDAQLGDAQGVTLDALADSNVEGGPNLDGSPADVGDGSLEGGDL